jgi:formamidopyrimidine-DNA glycosylase
MPELPEVETLRRGLLATVAGKRVEGIDVLWAKSLNASAWVVDDVVVGHRIIDIRRRGKVLILDLDNGYYLLLHPRMTGQLVVTEHGSTRFAGGHPSRSMLAPMPNVTTRVIVRLSGGTVLFVNDQRKFARIMLVDTSALLADPFLARLGPEPLSDDFSVMGFREQLMRHPRAPIKSVILDQATVAGVGNIYADESLHLARIHPQRRAGTLSAASVTRLHQAIRTVLDRAVEDGGTSFEDYANAFRGHGTHLASARLFRRQAQPCVVCGTRIQRTRVAGRGTNVCPRCQRPR